MNRVLAVLAVVMSMPFGAALCHGDDASEKAPFPETFLREARTIVQYESDRDFEETEEADSKVLARAIFAIEYGYFCPEEKNSTVEYDLWRQMNTKRPEMLQLKEKLLSCYCTHYLNTDHWKLAFTWKESKIHQNPLSLAIIGKRVAELIIGKDQGEY